MKSIWICILLLLAGIGCGGYGSGMGMTPAPTPLISPSSGTYTVPLTVTITDSLGSATIYYTTNGTMPSLSSARYTGPIVLNASGRVQAIAAANGYSTSGVAIADFTLQ